eukprot:3831849-Rhodomonas_salina.2
MRSQGLCAIPFTAFVRGLSRVQCGCLPWRHDFEPRAALFQFDAMSMSLCGRSRVLSVQCQYVASHTPNYRLQLSALAARLQL